MPLKTKKSQDGEQEKSQTSTVTDVQSTKFKQITGCQSMNKISRYVNLEVDLPEVRQTDNTDMKHKTSPNRPKL